MCRFALYLGPEITVSSLVTEPVHSIIHQSYHAKEREEPLNGDGFGVAWYAPEIRPEPAILRSVSPAWSNQNLRSIAPVTRSHCILAHIRAASPGLPVTELNCHPFATGPFAFMHNGTIGGFLAIRRRLLATMSDDAFDSIDGSTDSEHAFAIFLDEIQRESDRSAESMRKAIVRTIDVIERIKRDAGVDQPSLLNFAVTNGSEAVVTRFASDPAHHNTLYVHTGRRYLCEDGICRMIDPDTEAGAVIVASEPLSTDPGWRAVAIGEAVLIDEQRGVTTAPCTPGDRPA